MTLGCKISRIANWERGEGKGREHKFELGVEGGEGGGVEIFVYLTLTQIADILLFRRLLCTSRASS
jgi:hypothetical protein